MSALAPATRALLVLIAKRGPLSIAGLLDLPDTKICPVIADASESLRSRIITLRQADLVKGFKFCSSSLTEYELTAKGKRFLAGAATAGDSLVGQIAGPRIPYSADPYLGEPHAFIRPGGQDFIGIPSVQGGVRIERRAPALVASKRQGQTR